MPRRRAGEFEVVAKRCLWLALAFLIGGAVVLFLELGRGPVMTTQIASAIRVVNSTSP